MFSKNGTILVAILLASSAAAAPLSAAQSDGVQAVIDALKSQLKTQGISEGDIPVDKTKAHLREAGFLDDETMSKLNDEIKVMTSEGGISVDQIAEVLIDELRSKDIIQKQDQEGIAKDVLVIDPELVERVMTLKSEANIFCPPGANKSRICCPL